MRSFLSGTIRDSLPAHLNVCFEEPGADELASLEGLTFCEPEQSGQPAEDAQALLEYFLEDCEGLLVMLGNLQEYEREGLLEFLQRLGAPVLAEAGSGLREKLPGLLQHEAPADVRKVLRIGGVPAARFWRDLEDRAEVRVFSVSRGRFSGLARGGEVIGSADWRELKPAATRGGVGSSSRSQILSGEPRWFRFLSERIPPGSLVFLGNSLPIREWNQAATTDDRGLRCFSCRGANGIDGALSTFLGLSEQDAESWAIVGDLTTLYDLSAPWILQQLSPGKRRIVVINNGGGRIFSKLPALAGLPDSERRAIENDHALSFEHWAAMWGMDYLRVDNEKQFVVDSGVSSLVIEIVIPGGEI